MGLTAWDQAPFPEGQWSQTEDRLHFPACRWGSLRGGWSSAFCPPGPPTHLPSAPWKEAGHLLATVRGGLGSARRGSCDIRGPEAGAPRGPRHQADPGSDSKGTRGPPSSPARPAAFLQCTAGKHRGKDEGMVTFLCAHGAVFFCFSL